MSARGTTVFTPEAKVKPAVKHISLEVDLDLHRRIKIEAKRRGLSIDNLSLQAIRFALDHLEDSK